VFINVFGNAEVTRAFTKNLILIRKADVKKSFANLLMVIIAMDHFAAITEAMINPLEMSSLRETAA